MIHEGIQRRYGVSPDTIKTSYMSRLTQIDWPAYDTETVLIYLFTMTMTSPTVLKTLAVFILLGSYEVFMSTKCRLDLRYTSGLLTKDHTRRLSLLAYKKTKY